MAFSFTNKPILVIGDCMLDRYIYGTAKRLSPEAPVPIINIERSSYSLGGAANVAANIKSLGGSPILFGTVSNKDSASREMLRLLDSMGIESALMGTDRPTILKERIIANSQQVARLDHEQPTVLDTEDAIQLHDNITKKTINSGAIVISDYGKGLITRALIRLVLEQARFDHIPVFLDPKVSNRDIYPRHGITCITPNTSEALGLAGVGDDTPHEMDSIGKKLAYYYGTQYILVTRGEDGMSLFSKTGPEIAVEHIPTAAEEVFDVSGAGDTVIAALAYAFASGVSMNDAAKFANAAAGVVVGKAGTATATLDEVRQHNGGIPWLH